VAKEDKVFRCMACLEPLTWHPSGDTSPWRRYEELDDSRLCYRQEAPAKAILFNLRSAMHGDICPGRVINYTGSYYG